MAGIFPCKGSGNDPQTELLLFQARFAKGDQCFEEIRSRLVEETKVCAPRHVADDVNSGFANLGRHRAYLSNFTLENGLRRARLRSGRTARLQRRIRGNTLEDGASHWAMACLAWIASELVFAQPAFWRESSYRRSPSARGA